MDLLTFERKGNCNSTHGMCIDNKVFIILSTLKIKQVFNYQQERKRISTDHIFTVIRRGSEFYSKECCVSFCTGNQNSRV